MTKLLIALTLFAGTAFGQAAGPVKPSMACISSVISPCTSTGLPTASAWTGGEILILDGASTCDVSTGSGTTRVKAVSNGTAWVTPNCGGGSSSNVIQTFAGNGLGSSGITAGTTTEYLYFQSGYSALATSVNEKLVQVPVAFSGHIVELIITFIGTQPSSGSAVVTVNHCTPTAGACAGSASLATVTMPASGTAQQLIYSCASSCTAVTAGDYISLQMANNATGASAFPAQYSVGIGN
jgi:hypothetical protein